jgi:AmmeMemoRadiSam system protein A
MDILSRDDRAELLELARESIAARFAGVWQQDPPRASTSKELIQPRSAFVTLRIGTDLRGCCGSLDASRALYVDVWRNAVAAAFGDSRFRPLSESEWPLCQLHISVLSAPEPLPAMSEPELLAALRPHVDGLVLELPHAVRANSSYVAPGRATFLPAVWEQLPDPQSFLGELKRKAGWPADFWSADILVSRYHAEEFGEEDH